VSTRDYRTYKKGLSESKKGNVLTLKVARLFKLVSHKRIMSRSLEKTQLDAKIVSVGNITFGGSGKTPHVDFLAFHFTQRGLKTGIATGGWGGSARKEGILVSDGDEIYTDFESAGDEAMSISESVLEISVPVFAHWNRIIAAEELIKRFNCDVVILDDAYHFVSVEKDADILLVDSLNHLGGGHLSNTGLMREPISAIARADAIILTHADLVEKETLDGLKELIKTEKFENHIFESSYEPQSIACVYGDDIGREKPQNAKLIPMSGLGNPESFEKSLESVGVVNENPIRFNDHNIYTQKDLEIINAAIDEDSADGVVTTSKDWIRLKNHADKINGGIYVLHSEIIIESEFLKWLDERV
jgi:tetraacyldisaccharide 4'-kinase